MQTDVVAVNTTLNTTMNCVTLNELSPNRTNLLGANLYTGYQTSLVRAIFATMLRCFFAALPCVCNALQAIISPIQFATLPLACLVPVVGYALFKQVRAATPNLATVVFNNRIQGLA